jgi:hypothetical protein
MPRGKKGSNPELRVVDPITTNDLNDEQKGDLLVKGIERLEKLIEQKDKMVAAIRTQRKTMKSEGFERQEVDFALWVRREGDEAAKERVALQIRIAAWIGQPLGFQPSLDLGADERQAAE